MNTTKIVIINAVVALLLIIGVGLVVPKTQPVPQQSDVQDLGGLSERAIKATSLELVTVGTTTLKAKSTTPNRGFCLETYATSSATLVSLTLQASTTEVSATGIAWVPRYGACR